LTDRSINITERMEARVGIEPTYKGFADLSLTTWVPRQTWKELRFRLLNPGPQNRREGWS
jgi:hypothetical protein